MYSIVNVYQVYIIRRIKRESVEHLKQRVHAASVSDAGTASTHLMQ